MASVSRNRKTGERTLQFSLDGKRKSIWLGKMSKRDRATWKHHVEELVAARMQNNRAPYEETSGWVAGLDVRIHQKLANVDLVESREPETAAGQTRLAEFLDRYIAERDDVKPGTTMVYKQAERCLISYFGPDKPLADITSGHAEDWRRSLVRAKKAGGGGLAENTARQRCNIAKQFLANAVDRELIDRNPFGKMKKLGVHANRSRDYFVTHEEAAKVLAACPDAQWRLLFALSRYGGLRCPSEHLALRWGDVDWEHGRIVVRSPKTEHHEGKAERIIPLFPELRPYLQAVYDELLEDFDPKQHKLSEQPVITRYRHANSNLRTQLGRILRKAGLSPWPKLFQNLRATRETELAEKFPIHVVCAWMGNSQIVANKHYLQVTDDDFAAALAGPEKPLQKPLQTVADTSGQDQPQEKAALPFLGKSDLYSTCEGVGVGTS